MTIDRLLSIARSEKPAVRYARHVNNHAIAAYDADLGRFVPVAFYGLDNQWVPVQYELLINGQPTHSPSDWIE